MSYAPVNLYTAIYDVGEDGHVKIESKVGIALKVVWGVEGESGLTYTSYPSDPTAQPWLIVEDSGSFLPVMIQLAKVDDTDLRDYYIDAYLKG